MYNVNNIANVIVPKNTNERKAPRRAPPIQRNIDKGNPYVTKFMKGIHYFWPFYFVRMYNAIAARDSAVKKVS